MAAPRLDVRSDRSIVFDISDGICAYLVEGFGNQLFILAAAWAQAERLGCPLYVDASWYLRHAPSSARSYELGDLGHRAVDITAASPWESVSLFRREPGVVAADVDGKRLLVFTENGYGYDSQIHQIPPGTTITGYYQSPHYFENIAGKFYDWLNSVPLSDQEAAYVELAAADPVVSVHMRRGDYLREDILPYLGIAEAGFFHRAIALYDRLHPGSRYRIYTDSPDMALAELSEVSSASLAPDDSGLRSVAVMLAMARASGMVISNSTFSWWAAWMAHMAQPDVTVIAPRPWNRSGESASDLLLRHWITLDART